MNFTFGKYEDCEVDLVIDIDRKYCEWISEKIKNKEEHKELYSEIIKRLTEIEPEPENPSVMMFGKYAGVEIEDFIFNDKSYCEWILAKDSFKNEYPKTYDYLRKYYKVIYEEQASEIVFFYLLTFCKRDYLKVGITTNFIVKRIYSYTHTMNFYKNDVIEYKNSFVYMTNDTAIEKKVLNNFKKLRIDKKTERVKTSFDEIDNFISHEQKANQTFYYSKKCIKDFIPFDYGKEFKDSFYIKINEFVNFRDVYESHLKRLNLIDDYNPEFMETRQNRN